ncbi:MAG: cell division protein ZapA [Proteobacteria bacterium]|nr:cell division protein ZapA [Pseudomonadota bacterium]MCZ6784719.1 cell division protein ZapA [Pseudomonadota bacterium]
MAKDSVALQINGQEYRVRGDDEALLQNAARAVDRTMGRIRDRTGTIDSLDVAVLTALNLARELIGLRETQGRPDPERIRELIDIAESALADS